MRARILLIMCALVTGCLPGCMTTYQYTHPSGQSLTIRSYREFPGGIDIQYNEDGLSIKSGEVTNGGDVEALSNLMLQMLPLIQPQ